MAAVPLMSLRGERSVPTFDKAKPNDLGRFFRQLETLFTRSQVVDDTEKKEYATNYVTANVAETWEAIPEYTTDTYTYIQFRDRLFEVYNQLSLRYILSNLNQLIGKRQRVGMRNLQDLSDFHLSFNAIATYLAKNNLLSSREQSQSYLRVFDEALQSKIIMRLQILLPNHHPSLPYEINEVYDAAKWILQGIPGTSASSYAIVLATATADPGFIKTEQLGSFLQDFTKTIVDTLHTNNVRTAYANAGSPP
jgi:hypothetical protein